MTAEPQGIDASCLPSHLAGLQQGRPHEWGVFARRSLVRGTLLGELTGLVCTGEVSLGLRLASLVVLMGATRSNNCVRMSSNTPADILQQCHA